MKTTAGRTTSAGSCPALTALATLGGPDAFAYGIGHSGRIVGTAETPEMYESGFHMTRPVVWEDGEVRDLGTLGGPIGAATAIAPSGMIVGACEPAAVEPSLRRRPDRACVWEDGSVRDLGDLGGPAAAALDVNARGWTVGFAMTATSYPSGECCEEHAFRAQR